MHTGKNLNYNVTLVNHNKTIQDAKYHRDCTWWAVIIIHGYRCLYQLKAYMRLPISE